MDFLLQRYSMVAGNGGSTQGLLFEKQTPAGLFICHTLEDEYRAVKVPGETRIWAGNYKLRILKVENDWVLRHRAKYNLNGDNWFKYPIEITGVKDFAGILLHAGIDQTHTEGCVLCDDTMGNNTVDKANQGARSLEATKRFYSKAYPFLDGGGQSFIEVRDEPFLMSTLKAA